VLVEKKHCDFLHAWENYLWKMEVIEIAIWTCHDYLHGGILCVWKNVTRPSHDPFFCEWHLCACTPIFRFSRIVCNNARFYHDIRAALSWLLAHQTPNLGDQDIGARRHHLMMNPLIWQFLLGLLGFVGKLSGCR